MKSLRLFSTIQENGLYKGHVISFAVAEDGQYYMQGTVELVEDQPSRYHARRKAAEAYGLNYSQIRRDHETLV